MSTVQEMAIRSLSELVKHVFAHRIDSIGGITYQELATRIGKVDKNGVGIGLGMGRVLGAMGHMIKALEDDWGSRIPYIQSLVVNKQGDNTGLPAEGISEFWPDYQQLTRAERENRIRIEYKLILDFGSRWNSIMAKLGMEPITFSMMGGHFGGQGESNSHKELKAYVAAHPEIVGATSQWHCEFEYPLPSLDEIDVLFRTDGACIAVEVKSAVSDRYPFDFERGLYQTIKYKAILTAMAKDGRFNIPEKINSILVVASKLPTDLSSRAEKLGITVIDEVLKNNC